MFFYVLVSPFRRVRNTSYMGGGSQTHPAGPGFHCFSVRLLFPGTPRQDTDFSLSPFRITPFRCFCVSRITPLSSRFHPAASPQAFLDHPSFNPHAPRHHLILFPGSPFFHVFRFPGSPFFQAAFFAILAALRKRRPAQHCIEFPWGKGRDSSVLSLSAILESISVLITTYHV